MSTHIPSESATVVANSAKVRIVSRPEWKVRIFSPTAAPSFFETKPKVRSKKAGYNLSEEAYGNEKECAGESEYQSAIAGEDGRQPREMLTESCHGLGMTGGGNDRAFRNPEHCDGENQRHGTHVEEALDDVYGELRTERQAGLFRNEVGADGVGNSADERDCGKAHDLGADQRKR